MLVRRATNNWFPSLFGDFFDNAVIAPARQFASPAVNILENEGNFEIEVAAPGMNKEDLSIQVENDDELLITLERKSEGEEKEKRNYLRREFSYSSYRQAFTLPEDIDKESISAQMTNGVLRITLPKKEETVRVPATRKIEID